MFTIEVLNMYGEWDWIDESATLPNAIRLVADYQRSDWIMDFDGNWVTPAQWEAANPDMPVKFRIKRGPCDKTRHFIHLAPNA